jgi:cytochrome c2
MGFAGLGKAEDRVNVIAYIDGVDGSDDIVIEAAAEEAPAEEAPAEEASVEEAAVEEAAAEEAPAEEAAAAEAAPEAPAEQAEAVTEVPADETAAETPAEQEAAAVEPVKEAPAVEVAEEPAAEAPAESAFAALVAAADVAEGEKVFRRCAACHAVEEGKNKVGPSLYGVVGRDIASVEGVNYSDALKGLDGEWTVDKLSAWIENPRGFAPGNRMGYPGLKDEQDRANVIGYLKSVAN